MQNTGQLDLDGLLHRHSSFWDLSNHGGPLLAELPHPSWSRKPYPLSGGRLAREPHQLAPEDFDVARIVGADRPLPSLNTGDSVHCVKSLYSVALLESVIGCPVFASETSCYSKPAIGPGESPSSFDSDAACDGAWASVLDGMLAAQVRRAGGAMAAGQLHLRGIVDMLAAYLGEVRLCTGLYDDPGEIRNLADRFTEVYVRIARRGLDLRPTWRGGRVSTWGLYAPGDLLDYQIDASSIISPELYREHLLEYDQRVIREFEFTLMHLHACGLHMVDTVLDIEELRCIEITLERETGVWNPDAIIDASRAIQARGKTVLLNGELDETELGHMVSSLQPEGLAIFYWKPLAN